MRILPRGLIAFGVLALAAAACTRRAATVTPGVTPWPAGDAVRFLVHGGLNRSYAVHVPAPLDRRQPAALVFVFHGGTGNAESAIRMSAFSDVADREGFVVVYPNGTGRLSDEKLLTWNGGACCGYAQEKNIDDVGFIRAMVADLQTILSVDPRRIYATGMSNGGILSHRLGCEAADLFAAIAPVAGTLNFSPCEPSRPVSVIEFHGTDDPHILYDGGYGPASLVKVDFTSVQYSVDFWSTFDRCNFPSQTEAETGFRHSRWTGCAESSAVELYTVVGGGHEWPGGPGNPGSALSATELIWAFFDSHPKPEEG